MIKAPGGSLFFNFLIKKDLFFFIKLLILYWSMAD